MFSRRGAGRRTGSLKSAALAAVAMAGAIAGTATPAHSWVHSLGDKVYYMPGGPSESYLSACIVETNLAKFPEGDAAYLLTYAGILNGLFTRCRVDLGSIQIVTYDGRKVENGRLALVDPGIVGRPQGRLGTDTYIDTGLAVSTGDYGKAIIGANVCAANTDEPPLFLCWQITVF